MSTERVWTTAELFWMASHATISIKTPLDDINTQLDGISLIWMATAHIWMASGRRHSSTDLAKNVTGCAQLDAEFMIDM